jgi:hypothetical protein
LKDTYVPFTDVSAVICSVCTWRQPESQMDPAVQSAGALMAVTVLGRLTMRSWPSTTWTFWRRAESWSCVMLVEVTVMLFTTPPVGTKFARALRLAAVNVCKVRRRGAVWVGLEL